MKMWKPVLISLLAGIGIYMLSKTSMAKSLLKKWEGLRLEPYQDAAGYWTIGYGHKIVPGDPYYPQGSITQISEAEADALLEKDMATARQYVLAFTRVPLSPSQLDALTSFVFNIGPTAFRDSTMLRLINEGNFSEAANEFGRWVHAGGQKLAGLVSRRGDEQSLFLS